MYIISFLPKILGGSCNKIEKNLLRKGFIVNTSNHEIGHTFININFYMKNGRETIETPRKNGLDIKEGGFYIELALYGRILEMITIEQALYILNEANYDKEFLDFQEGFNNIKKEDLKITGVFEKSFMDFNLNENTLKINKNIYIPQRESVNLQTKGIYCKIKNDVLGRFISDKKYNEIYKKYSS